jgi:release factor glutamine methyltransferase
VSTDALYRRLKAVLAEGGVDSAPLEARWIVTHVTGRTMADILAAPDTPVTDEQRGAAEEILTRRLAGEPLSRIFGAREFRGLSFELSPDTLDPRPDTEVLVERALAYAATVPGPLRILDLGTGTGCILIALLHVLPGATGVAVDLSPGAAEMAKRNARANGVETRMDVRCGSWFEPVRADETFHIIVSNPPYIRESVIESLSPEVKNHDPILALSGGIDGLAAYKAILRDLKKHLFPGGRAFFEIGFDQAEDLARLVDDSHATLIRTQADYGGNPRVVEITYGEN